ncbi:hypothetical protein Q644_24505 [Brucella intermedia 229E]|uniref:Uncharacterized protein n=1 Tax=Brucella intermedia 229E TaxID=1337887 RepID=U4VDH7_9HYPH|nr:hypothetical protein Q644_24505 [Brucella intermedia 229E]
MPRQPHNRKLSREFWYQTLRIVRATAREQIPAAKNRVFSSKPKDAFPPQPQDAARQSVIQLFVISDKQCACASLLAALVISGAISIKLTGSCP